jgi:protein-S-isoprenylcysteine O-methyltransferase Ste14
MLEYIICAGIWVGIVFGWIIPVIRKRIVYEIYVACGVGIYFSLIVLGWIWKTIDIQPLLYIGYTLIVLGIAFFISSIRSLKHKGKPKSGWEHTTEIVDSNIFRVVRHPLYLGGAIAMVGIVLVVQSIPSTILGLVAIFCFWMASKKEDEFNIKKFGDGYKEYMKKVPMWNILKGLNRNRLRRR